MHNAFRQAIKLNYWERPSLRTRHHNMNPEHIAQAGSQCSDIMLHNSICVLQDCSVLLFCCSSAGKKRQTCTYGSIFPLEKSQTRRRRMCCKSVVNHWKSVRDVLAGFQREMEVLEVFTCYNIGYYILLCSHSMRLYGHCLTLSLRALHNVPS